MHFRLEIGDVGSPVFLVDPQGTSIVWEGEDAAVVAGERRITVPRVPVGPVGASWPEKAWRVKRELERAVVAIDALVQILTLHVNQTVFCVWDKDPTEIAVLTYWCPIPDGVETLELHDGDPDTFAEMVETLLPKLQYTGMSMGCTVLVDPPCPACEKE